MSEGQGSRDPAMGLSLLSVKAPDLLGNGGLSSDVVLAAVYALGDLEEKSHQDALRAWIEGTANKGLLRSWECESLPPLTIVRFPDLLGKLWGWDRLLAYECRNFKYRAYISFYDSYLDKFYTANNGPDYDRSNAATLISKCLAKEKEMCSAWEAEQIPCVPIDAILTPCIEDFMTDLLNDPESISRHPFVTYAAACITTGAELMLEWVRCGYSPENVDASVCYELRDTSLELAMLEGNFPIHAAAALLGLEKEAKFLLGNAKCGNMEAPEMSRTILSYGLEYLHRKLGEFQSNANLTPELSDEETTSTVEEKHLEGGKFEDVSFGEYEMQEHCGSPEE